MRLDLELDGILLKPIRIPLWFVLQCKVSETAVLCIKGDDGSWYVVELCEPLQSLIDMCAEFYVREDAADLPAAERQDDADQQDPDAIAPEDEVRGRDIGNQDSLMLSADGREIPADRVVVNAADFEKVIVNGVELTAESSLAALRSGCSFYGFSVWWQNEVLWTFGESLKLELLRDAALQLNLKGNRIHQRWQFHHLKRPKGNMNSHTHLV